MIQIYENNNWVSYHYTIPYVVNDKKDETEDNSIISFISSNDTEYPPKTKVKLIDETETHWIIQNCTCTLIGFNVYEKTLELIEPIELTKGYPIDNLTVTQPLTPDASHPKKTIRNVINRLLLIAITHEQFDINMNLASIISLVDAEGITDIEAPEDVFTECYLFDALVKIGLYMDCMPKLSFNVNNNFDLTFEPLDIKNKNNYTLDKLTLKEKQYPLSNYANQIVSNIYNTTSKTLNTFPGGDAIGTKIVTDGDLSLFNLDFSNGYIKIPSKIKDVIKFEFSPDIGTGTIWYDFSDFIYEYKEWQLLSPLALSEDPDYTTTPIHKRQPYTCYYTLNDNKIRFGDSFLNYTDFLKLTTPFLWIADFLGLFNKEDFGFQKILMKYRITFLPQYDARIKIGSSSIHNFSMIANQDGNMIDSDAYNRKMRNILKRMKHGDYLVGKIFKNYNDIPKIGHMINNQYVITNLSYTRYKNFYDVSLHLSEGYTRRSEYVKEKQEIRSWEIPANKASDRFINYKDKITISFFNNTSNNNSAVKGIRILFPILNIFPVESQDLMKFPGLLSAMYFKAKEYTYPLLCFPMVTNVDNNLLINIYADDNTIFGHQLVNTGTKHFQKGVTYTDEYGEFETVDIALTTFWVNYIDNDVFRAMPNATTGLINNLINENPIAVNLNNIVIKKDARETFKFTYQVTVESDTEETIITKHFAAYNQNTVGWKNREKIVPYIFFYNQKINSVDELTESNFISKIQLIKSSSSNPLGANDTFVFEFDKTKVPQEPIVHDTIESFAIGVVDDGEYKPLIIQNKVDQLLDEIKNSGKITLYCDY